MVTMKKGGVLERLSEKSRAEQQQVTASQPSKVDRLTQGADRLFRNRLSGEPQTFVKQRRFSHGE